MGWTTKYCIDLLQKDSGYTKDQASFILVWCWLDRCQSSTMCIAQSSECPKHRRVTYWNIWVYNPSRMVVSCRCPNFPFSIIQHPLTDSGIRFNIHLTVPRCSMVLEYLPTFTLKVSKNDSTHGASGCCNWRSSRYHESWWLNKHVHRGIVGWATLVISMGSRWGAMSPKKKHGGELTLTHNWLVVFVHHPNLKNDGVRQLGW